MSRTLEEIRDKTVPTWYVYKYYKTCNEKMVKYCRFLGLRCIIF